jgi:phytanoyl-CoA hydroxylase
MTQTVSLSDLEFQAENIDVQHASEAFKTHGAIVVRGLLTEYIDALARDIEATARQSLDLLNEAKEIPEGWRTPNNTLFIPAPENYERDQQIMVLGINYQTSAVFFRSAFHAQTLDIVEAILGPNIELFGNGQCLYKEPVGGHSKHLHQDSAYFEHRYEGPVGILTYVVPTDLNNGALHVVASSHKLGQLNHIDTSSHLGLDGDEWPWERALPILGQPGDAIFFNVKTIHGSKQNHSDKPRPVFIHRYRRAEDYTIVRGTTTENRAESAKRVEEAKKENQRGFMIRGFRPHSD